MSIQELVEIVAPPSRPLEVGSKEDWRSRQAAVGNSYPPDLFDLCSTYGSGWFMGVTIYNPFSSAYLAVIQHELALYRHIKNVEGKRAIPYEIFPDRPGILPCGREENGGQLFWLLNGDSKRWPLILMGSVFTWETKDISITSFLAKSFRGEMECIWWDQEWQKEEFTNVIFRPESMSGESG